MPAVSAPSPITATTLFLPPERSRATAMPSADEIDVEECAAPNGSYSLSARLVKPDRPLPMPQRADAVAAAGENLVRIGLMADVPDNPVPRGVEYVVQGDRELDHAETGAKVPAGDGDRIDGLGPQFVGDLPELAFLEPPEVVRGVDLIKEGRLGRFGHQIISDKLLKRRDFQARIAPNGAPHIRGLE